MSLDRSPIPSRGGGWSSPGLTTTYEEGVRVATVTPSTSRNGDVHGVSWASAKANSARVQGYPSYHGQDSGFFGRHMRRLSDRLPRFSYSGDKDRYAEKEKLGRGRSWRGGTDWRDLPRRLGYLLFRRRKFVLALVLLVVALLLLTSEPVTYLYRRTSWLGGGSKFVLILAANPGGGVMDMKGAREWAIERDSVGNKKRYVKKWGYDLNIVDMSTKKRYAHEWREGWEKVDVIRNTMKKYPDAEWFWWLDLNTFIMEPTYSLQHHLFEDITSHTYRDINIYNPLNIQHPPNGTSGDPGAPQYANYLDPIALSAIGDGKDDSINLIVSQDCGGFNLGSFFIRRSPWTDRLLDIWWDPVFYEQRHMEWEHKEQDALEYIYTNQPWVRPGVAFIAQRAINAFPHEACGDDLGVPDGGCANLDAAALADPDARRECGVQGIHYQEHERDFVVNMAGCEWGRDCWGEMYNFRQLSNRLNRNWWEKWKDSWREAREAKEEAGRKAQEAAEQERQQQQDAGLKKLDLLVGDDGEDFEDHEEQ